MQVNGYPSHPLVHCVNTYRLTHLVAYTRRTVTGLVPRFHFYGQYKDKRIERTDLIISTVHIREVPVRNLLS
jgi:hypothetical protein